MSESQFYEWLFGPVKSSGLSRNGPQELYIISNEKAELRELVFKEGRLESIKNFFWN